MDLHHKQEVTVGALVLFGIGLFVVGTMWLKGTTFARRPKMQIVFPDAGSIKRGSAVRVSGVEMGKVDDVEFQDVGRVLVTINLSKRIQPRIDAIARLVSVGLAGDAAINLDPGKSTEPLPPDKPIQGVVGQGLTELGTELGDEAKKTMAGVREVANERLAEDLHATLTALQRFIATYTNPKTGPAGQLTSTLATMQQLSLRLDSILIAANLPLTFRKSDTLVTQFAATGAQLTATTARLDTVLLRLQQGNGTVGRLMTDTLLYTDLRHTIKSLQEFIDTLRKNPGKIGVQVKIF
jgi:phospholipid/cholesterol/gamma-HCH transport system substrate-binding protein